MIQRRNLTVAVALSVGLGLGWGAASPAEAVPAQLDVARIDRYLHGEMRRHGLPGLAVGVVEGDRVVHTRAFGPGLTADTPMVLASVSKPLTATAVLQLVDGGRVSLDTPVRTYLPDFRLADDEASRVITVRQLLNHTSGLPPSSCEIEADTLEQFVHHLRHTKLDRAVGSTYEYCSGNYNVLGLLVERVSGMPFARYMQDRVFAPLGMTHSAATDLPRGAGGLATGHQWLFGFKVADHYYNASDLPAGYLESSAEDMSHFVVAQLNGGRYESAQLLSPTAVEAMHAPSVDAGGGEAYGLGWVRGSQGGVPAVYHYGTNYDAMTFVVLEPQLGRGAVLLIPGQTLVAATAVRTMEIGLSRLLAGEPPPKGAMNLHLAYVLVDSVFLALIAGAAVPLAGLRRWARLPGRAAHRRRARTRAIAEALFGVLLVVGLRFVFVQLGANWFEMLRATPDIAGAVVVTGGLFVATGVARAAALRRRSLP